MKKLLLLSCFLLLTSFAFADKIRVTVEFSRYLYTCPKGHELVTESNKQKWTCPICGEVMGEGSYKECHPVLNFSPEEFVATDNKKMDTLKQERFDAWVYEIKHPPIYVEPTAEDFEKMIADKQAEIENLQVQKLQLYPEKIVK